MSVRRTELDNRRTRKALALTGELIDSGYGLIGVIAGGRRGPYTVHVDRLNEAEMRAVVAAVRREVDRLRGG